MAPSIMRPEDRKPPNWTPNPRWIDIFKGRDDEKVVFKTLLMSKYTGIIGASVAFTDIWIATQAKTMTVALQRVLYWNVPIIGGGIAYTSTVCIVSSLTGRKEDPWNHFFGGLAGGTVCGAARRSFFFGAMCGVALGIYGALHKDCVLQNLELWPDVSTKNPRRGWALSHKQDYTMKPNRPGYWVREAPTPGQV